jgi:hypothetical protein
MPADTYLEFVFIILIASGSIHDKKGELAMQTFVSNKEKLIKLYLKLDYAAASSSPPSSADGDAVSIPTTAATSTLPPSSIGSCS